MTARAHITQEQMLFSLQNKYTLQWKDRMRTKKRNKTQDVLFGLFSYSDCNQPFLYDCCTVNRGWPLENLVRGCYFSIKLHPLSRFQKYYLIQSCPKEWAIQIITHSFKASRVYSNRTGSSHHTTKVILGRAHIFKYREKKQSDLMGKYKRLFFSLEQPRCISWCLINGKNEGYRTGMFLFRSYSL